MDTNPYSVLITSEMISKQLHDEELAWKFKKLFPEGCQLTRENLELALDNELRINPIIFQLFNSTDWWRFIRLTKPAEDVYNQSSLNALANYYQAIAPYEEALEAAKKAYEEARAPYWQAYDQTIKAALKLKHRLMLDALVDILELE